MRKSSRKQLIAFVLVLGLLAGAGAAAPQIHGYTEGLALTTENGLWGYADTAGKIVIPIQYNSAQSFRLGLAKVEVNGKLGIIRPDGKYLIRAEYDTLNGVGYGVYVAQKGDYWGLLSIVPFPSGLGGETQELYAITYDDLRLTQRNGLDVLEFAKDGAQTVVPISSLPNLLVERKAPSAQFPLIQNRLPNFKDVGPRDWYDLWVNLAYNVGLIDGKGDGTFDPEGTLTVAEAVKLAAFMESRYTGDDFHLQPITLTPWYRSSVAYCVASGIMKEGDFDSFDRPITRAEMAKLFAATSLSRAMPAINALDRVKKSLPDVGSGDYAADAIYALYSKGVFTGTDGSMTFRPKDNQTRAETAAIVSRMARTEQRISLWSSTPRSAGSLTETGAV
ncbi:MAG: hypothetical protein EOM52_00985 [Clostridia bacterium]|nr:hypothetical protein [Clostridia bacterium]